MLEANPKLTPQAVKRILISTAERLPGYEVDRQGWGVVDPRKAVEAALAFQTK
jgi:serine protease AprX